MKKRLTVALLGLIATLAIMVEGCALGSFGSCAPSPSGTNEDNYLSIVSSPQASQVTNTSDNVSWLITWETDRPASSQVAYGSTITYGSLTPLDPALVTNHSVTLSGLKPSTTYEYMVISIDEAGERAEAPGDPFTTAIQFTFVSSQVTLAKEEWGGNTKAALLIRFNASDSVYFKLTDPDGLLVGTSSAEKGVTGAVLPMANAGETPKDGAYTLLVEAMDLWGQTAEILAQALDYQGANVIISDLSVTYAISTSSEDSVQSDFSFKVSNTGDLPACITQGEFSLGGSPVAFSVSGIVMPGETKTFSASASGSIKGIPPGQKEFTLNLKDSQDTVVATWSTTCQGAKASVSELSCTWSYWDSDYRLDDLSFKVSNSGDLPVYIAHGECSLGGSTATLTLSGTVLPGGTKSFSASPYLSGVSAGQEALELTLKDAQGNVVATYTTDVTPG